MPVLGKTEEIVIRVLKRLRRAKELALEPVIDDGMRNHLVSKFQEIEELLQTMEGLLPEVKRIETDLVERFKTLEKEIDDDILKEHGNLNEISQKLQLLLENSNSLKDFVLSVKLVSDSGSSASAKQIEQSLEAQPRITSVEWSQLINLNSFIRSESTRSLLQGFGELPTSSKLCLLFLSIFPENCEIKRRPLIYWLIAEDVLAANSDGDSADEVGDRIFSELIDRHFIKANKNTLTLHPCIRRMIIELAQKAELFKFDGTGMPINGRQRFFMSSNQDLHFVQNGNGRDEALVTVFNVNRNYLSFTADSLSRLEKLVVLQLGRWQVSPKHHIELQNDDSLKGLRSLKRLRYLSLRGISRIFTLPRYVTELVSLEILDLRACPNLEKLPNDISLLRNLTHLDISECYLIESMPISLGKLTKLQVLKGLVVGNSSKGSFKISYLAGLGNLRKLGIHIGLKVVIEEEDFKALEKILSLRNLTISWAVDSNLPSPQPGMNSLRLPSQLRKLDLRCIPEDTLPEWVYLSSLDNLEKLYIRGGTLERLRCPKVIRSIRIMRLKYLKRLAVSEEQLKEMFPGAVYLEAVQCQGADILWNKEDDRKLSF